MQIFAGRAKRAIVGGGAHSRLLATTAVLVVCGQPALAQQAAPPGSVATPVSDPTPNRYFVDTTKLGSYALPGGITLSEDDQDDLQRAISNIAQRPLKRDVKIATINEYIRTFYLAKTGVDISATQLGAFEPCQQQYDSIITGLTLSADILGLTGSIISIPASFDPTGASGAAAGAVSTAGSAVGLAGDSLSASVGNFSQCSTKFTGTIAGYANLALGQGISAFGGKITIGNPDGQTYQRGIALGGGSLSGAGEGLLARTTNANDIAIGNNAFAGGDATALGLNANASGFASIALGAQSQATGIGAVAAGIAASAGGANALAAGTDSAATGVHATALGSGATATGESGVAVGDTALAQGGNSIAVGSAAIANGGFSSAFGPFALADGERSLAAGFGAQALGFRSIAVGQSASASNVVTVAIGFLAKSSGEASTAVGNAANAGGASAVALGDNAGASGNIAVAVGASSTAGGDQATSIGATAQASGMSSFAGAVGATAGGAQSIAIGANSRSPGGDAIALGDNALALTTDTIAIGRNAGALNPSAVALGPTAAAQGAFSTVVGAGAAAGANGVNSSAFGAGANAFGAGATALGASAQGSGTQTVALGRSASASGDRAVALGAFSSATGASSVAVGQNSVADQANTISVGTSGGERRIVNVAAGTANTDAVNLGQLNAAVVGIVGGGVAPNTLISQVTVNDPINVGLVTGGTEVTFSGLAGTRVLSGLSNGTVAAGSTQAITGDQLFATNSSITNLSNQINMIGPGLVQQAAAGANLTVGVATDGAAVSFTGTAGNRVLTGVAAGAVNGASIDAVNGSQLFATNQQVVINTTNIASNTLAITNLTNQMNNGNVGLVQQAGPGQQLTVGAATNGANVNFAGTAGSRTLSGVAAGSLSSISTQAVNGSQLFATNQTVATHTASINTLNAQTQSNTTTITNIGSQTNANSTAIVNLTTQTQTNTTAITNLGAQVGANSTTIVALQNGTDGPVRANNPAGASAPQAVGLNAIAGGNGAVAGGASSVALGAGASAAGNSSVAIGAGSSDGGEAGVVAIGSMASTRRLVNVSAGTRTTDAVNLGQLSAAANQAVSLATNYTDLRIAQISFDVRTLRRDANGATASALAIATVPQSFERGRGMFGVGTAVWQGQTAVAIGVSKATDSGDFVLNLRASYNSRGEGGAAAGAGFAF